MIKDAHWVTEELPENHKEMIFFMPECNKSNFYFLKDESNITILNDPNSILYKVYKSIRDDKLYTKKISKIKHNLKTFNQAKQKKTFKSEIDEAINIYTLYKLSKKNEGKIYEKNKKNSIDLKDLSRINKNTFIFNHSLKESLKIFNNEDILMYYTPDLRDIKSPEHVEIINILLKHYSKVIINSYENPVYKKYFKNWNKKKKPNQKNKLKVECVWKNF